MNEKIKIDWIGIDNKTNDKYIVDVNAPLLPETIMSNNEDDYESGLPRVDDLHIIF